MTSEWTDTSDEALEAQILALRELGPERRSELAGEWSELMRQTALQGIRDRNPHFNERRVFLEYARVTLGEELFLAAYSEAAALK